MKLSDVVVNVSLSIFPIESEQTTNVARQFAETIAQSGNGRQSASSGTG